MRDPLDRAVPATCHAGKTGKQTGREAAHPRDDSPGA